MRAGVTFLKHGMAEAAIEPLRNAARLRPVDLRTHEYLARALLESGRGGDAFAIYDHILRLRPRHGEAQLGRGRALQAMGDVDRALDTFRAASMDSPKAWLAWNAIADITSDENERIDAIARAADTLLKACRRPNRSPDVVAACADALIDARRHDEAVRFIHDNFDRFRRSWIAESKAASAHYHSGAFWKAFTHMDSALAAFGQEDLPQAAPDRSASPSRAQDALRGVIEILGRYGVRAFLVAGTLLGFVRHGALLAHDHDGDIGVIRGQDGSPDIAAIIREAPDLVLERRARPGDRQFKLIHHGAAIDIFLHDHTNDHIISGLSDHPGDLQWLVPRFDIAEAPFGAHTWPVPSPAEAYLEKFFGPAWKSRDARLVSDIASPALVEASIHARGYHSAARALASLRAGDRVRARALLRRSPLPLRADATRLAELHLPGPRERAGSDDETPGE